MTQQEKEKKIGDSKIVTDAVDVAEEAGLRYVSHDQPGYTRKTKGDDFDYFDTEGKPIRDEQRLLRISVSRFRPLTPMCGSVRQPTGTFRQRGAMRAVASSTGIMNVGGPRGTKTSMTGWCFLARPCPRFANAWKQILLCPAYNKTKCSPPLSSYCNGHLFASAMKSTRATTNRLA